jgi:hypothetical protein
MKLRTTAGVECSGRGEWKQEESAATMGEESAGIAIEVVVDTGVVLLWIR